MAEEDECCALSPRLPPGGYGYGWDTPEWKQVLSWKMGHPSTLKPTNKGNFLARTLAETQNRPLAGVPPSQAPHKAAQGW